MLTLLLFQVIIPKTNVFNKYCKKWKLKLNIDKTKALFFGNYVRNRAISFNIAGNETEVINEFKYRGVLFFKKMGDLFSILNIRHRWPKNNAVIKESNACNCQLKLFDQTIVPILMYGSETFGLIYNL